MIAPILPTAVLWRTFLVSGALAAVLTGCMQPPRPALDAPHHARHHATATPSHLYRLATEIAASEHVPARTALALVQVESRFNPLARSSAGAIGLTQIKCPTARGIGYSGSCAGLFDPRTNLIFGLRYLRGNLDQDGNECRALGHYYSGRWGSPNMAYCRLVLAAKSRIAEE